jgi:hypothetical protein
MLPSKSSPTHHSRSSYHPISSFILSEDGTELLNNHKAFGPKRVELLENRETRELLIYTLHPVLLRYLKREVCDLLGM